MPIPKPQPIPQPGLLPTPIPIPEPIPIQKPSALPGPATTEQPQYTPSLVVPLSASQMPRLTREGMPAIGQYLPPPPIERPEAVTAQLTAAAPPASAATGQISLPAPEVFWGGTAAARQLTIPTPEDIWRGVATTNSISLPAPEVFWSR